MPHRGGRSPSHPSRAASRSVRSRVRERSVAGPCTDAFEGQYTDSSAENGGAPCILSDALEQSRPPKESRGGYWSLSRSKCLYNRRFSLRTNFAIYF